MLAGWDWVDPKSDTESSILKVRAGLMSPQDLCAAMGYDFEDTLKSIAQAQQLAKEFGVALPAYDAKNISSGLHLTSSFIVLPTY